MDDYTLLHGDCLEAMAAMDAGSVDAVVCDPPYGLEFMGKEWDRLGDVGKVSHSGPREHDGATVFTRQRVNYNGSANVKCRKCGKWQWDHVGRKCECSEPEFANVKARQAAIMQDWHQAWATEALRVLKPSHYLLAFGGTRTWHRLACAIEDAGFEIRDTLMWLYGSGFPKGKSCLKPAWEPIILARKPGPMRELGIEECRIAHSEECRPMKDQPNYGKFYGQGGRHGDTLELKPSGRWPANLILECTCEETREGTVKTNSADSVRKGIGVLKHGGENARPQHSDTGGETIARRYGTNGKEPVRIHTDPSCPCALLDGQTGDRPGAVSNSDSGSDKRGTYSKGWSGVEKRPGHADSGGASRFFLNVKGSEHDDFQRGDGPDSAGGPGGIGTAGQGVDARFRYVAKASRSERNAGCEGMPSVDCGTMQDDSYKWEHDGKGNQIDLNTRAANHHPTVKPLALMRWLVKLVAQPGDVVLDPFAGSGTTGVACAMEGREFVGIEREAEYIEIARRRIEHAAAQTRLPVE